MVCRMSKSPYAHDDVFYSNHGTRVVPEYVLDFPERGGVALKQVGEKPIYEIIQSNLANCDLANVIESCFHSNQCMAVTPDSLNEMIADFTGLTNLGEFYSGTKRMENTWKNLPLEVRESFDGDIKKFIRGIGTDEFRGKVADGFNKYGKSLYKSKSKEVKDHASEYKVSASDGSSSSEAEITKPEVVPSVDKKGSDA